MITFKQYLQEKNGDDLVAYLRKNCLTAVHDMIDADKFFWRGQKRPLNYFSYKWGERDVDMIVQAPRDDRIPRDTPKWAHKVVDDYFEKKFGMRARQTSLFTYHNVSEAHGYGQVHLIIPFGNDYTCLWGPNTDDLTVELFPDLESGEANEHLLPGPAVWWKKTYPELGLDDITDEMREDRLTFMLDDTTFKLTGGQQALKGALGEILIQCEHYVAIPVGQFGGISVVKELFYEVASE